MLALSEILRISVGMEKETTEQRLERILGLLKEKFPTANAFAMDKDANHFVSEVEPTEEHPEYDKAIEVIIKSKSHKHLKMTQDYKVLSGSLKLTVNGKTVVLNPNDTFTVLPGTIHSAESDNEAWVEIVSHPGWTKEDHIPVEL